MFIKNFAKTSLAIMIATCLICSTTVAQQKAEQPDQQKVKQQYKDPAQSTIKTPFRPKVRGIDPAVISLKAEMVKMLSPSSAQVKIVGVVQNIGTQDFVSTPEQQIIRLVEKVPDASERVVAMKKFVNLKSGQKTMVEFTLPWTGSIAFPPNYQARIDYLRDIRADGNPRNDDIKLDDNKRHLQGSMISQQVKKFLASGGVVTAKKDLVNLHRLDREAITEAALKPEIIGIDPAVVGVRVEMLRKISTSTAEFKIIGTVRNVGSLAYVGGENQQSVQMYTKQPGQSSRHERAIQSFVSLEPGEIVQVEYTTNWTGSIEFPPDFVVEITYGVDLGLDSNTQNDDIRLTNNKKEIPGTTVKQKVERYLER